MLIMRTELHRLKCSNARLMHFDRYQNSTFVQGYADYKLIRVRRECTGTIKCRWADWCCQDGGTLVPQSRAPTSLDPSRRHCHSDCWPFFSLIADFQLCLDGLRSCETNIYTRSTRQADTLSTVDPGTVPNNMWYFQPKRLYRVSV